MFLNSIRWRLQLWHGLLLVLVLTGFGLTAYQLQRANQLKRVDQELQQRITVVGGALRGPMGAPGRPRPGPVPGGPPPEELLPPRDEGPERPPFRPEPPENFARGQALPPPAGDLHLPSRELAFFDASSSNAFYYIVWARDGRQLSHSDSAPADISFPSPHNQQTDSNAGSPTTGPGPNDVRMRGTFREMFHYTPPGECILVGRNIGRELSDIHQFAALLLGAGSSVLLVGLAGGWWLSTRAIRPIKDISNTAAKIATGDLSQRIPAADTENELGQLASVLNSTFARLETAFAQQARFTADAAHELRTPVSVMLTQAQAALTRERSAAEYRETLEAFQRATQRMRRLIESLLELSRLDAGQEPMRRTRFDLAALARDCIEQIRPMAAEREITLNANLPPTDCTGDSDRLSLVLTNLLSNAIHYSHPKGEVRVSTSLDNGSAICSVSDNGQGISETDLAHIFERFWRADPSRSRADGRTGLGLAIAKSIVDAHGGTIDVVSQPGRGSSFTLRLPCGVTTAP